MTDESNVITNDIPAVPQFLMRETDHHVLQAMAADTADKQDADPAGQNGEDGTAVPSPAVDLSASGSSTGGYSIEDLVLFRKLTGYRLDTRSPIWRAVDDDGNRVSTADRLFTTLAEEAFRFADRQRRLGGDARRDMTIDDLVLALPSIRRAANSIGSKGLIAFERLEAAILGMKEQFEAEAFITP